MPRVRIMKPCLLHVCTDQGFCHSILEPALCLVCRDALTRSAGLFAQATWSSHGWGAAVARQRRQSSFKVTSTW